MEKTANDTLLLLEQIAPGSWVSIYGSNLAAAARALASTDLVNSAIPASLGGVSVQINSKPAYVQYVSPTQINVLAPADTALGTVAVQVTHSGGTSNSVSATMSTLLPALSVLSGFVRAVRYPDGAVINGTGAAEPGYTTAAAVAPGTIVSLFGTGFGATTPVATPGLVFTSAYPTNNAVTVTIGGLPAAVSFAGLIGPGLYQINVTVPAALADGDHDVIATVNGQSSQVGAKLKVSAAARVGALARRMHVMLAGGPRPGELPLPGSPVQWIEHLIGVPAAQVAEKQTSGRLVQIA